MAGNAWAEAFARWSWTRANRRAARAAARVTPATGFVSQPEPRSIGLHARGRHLISGHFLLAGRLIEAPAKSLWDAAPPDPAAQAEAHGFTWLDDLAAVGDALARARAQDWTWDWIDRFGRGQGPGWVPDLTGRRLIRLINHAIFLLAGRSPDQARTFFAALSAQVAFLDLRWDATAPGLPRFEALTGLIYAALALTGTQAQVGAALTALAAECDAVIDAQGGIPARNPEHLLEVLSLLTWAAQALTEAGRVLPAAHGDAMARITPCLRTLRHADGSLARFHGGGRGAEGRLDAALAASGIKGQAGGGPAMGFLRLSGGRTSVIVDAADPPGGRAGTSAHASTLAFELTSGRRPVIVSCGSGDAFGGDWRRAGRATASHSTLALEGYSSSRFGRGLGDALTERAHVVMARHTTGAEGPGVYLAHDGWSRTHGLTHGRNLWLSSDGRRLVGQDSLGPTTAAERAALSAALRRRQGAPLTFALRFHLHPDADVALDMGGTAVSIALRSGEVWIFRPADARGLALEPSVYLERGRLHPRPARQIVIQGETDGTEVLIGWTLAKAQDTPLAIRDLERDDTPFPA
ncbi:MAG: heparinase II/III family protein [Paracoccaceae bacterium]|nr:MAG: heparinase II/III family protein [Paracoccaceae bacterium]